MPGLWTVQRHEQALAMWQGELRVDNIIDHRWHTQSRGLNLAFHLVLSGPAPCFYLVVAPSSHLTVKEELHVYSPKITFGPLKATTRLMWPPERMSVTPLKQYL